MVSLIIGHKGSGKTKHLIDEVSKAYANSNGHVICVEKNRKLTYDIESGVRLVSADDFAVSGYDTYYGFLAGMCGSDNDLTDVLGDGTLKIGGMDKEKLADFLEKVNNLGDATNTKFTFTISCDETELPERIFDYCDKI